MNRQMQEVLNKYQRLGPLPIEGLSPELARQQPQLRDAVMAVLNDHAASRLIKGTLEEVASVEHRLVAGPDHALLLRIYRPKGSGPFSGLVYFHGGGFVIGSLNSYDTSARSLCNEAECVVISVGYRQAPEHRYPAAREDALLAYEWVLANASSLDIEPEQIAVAGESAGGNLATVLCQLAKMRGIQMPVHQLLIYPLVDCIWNTPTYQEYATAAPLNRDMMKWFFQHLFHELDASATDPLAFPLRSEHLAGLPPATIFTAEIDPLRSEGEAYAEKLRSSGVPVYLERFLGVTHEFFGMRAVVDEARLAVELAGEQLWKAFEGIGQNVAHGDLLHTG